VPRTGRDSHSRSCSSRNAAPRCSTSSTSWVSLPLSTRYTMAEPRLHSRQEASMAATVREAVRQLLEQTMATMDALLQASDAELDLSSSHPCAQGKDLWTLITNDIDHEKIHTGEVLEGRYESRITASPMQRLIAEWLEERARFIGSLVGLSDEQFNSETAPGQWTYRVVAKHVLVLEQDSLKTLEADQAARRATG